ncbi:MAG: 23S rRNA (guanosine(2251)-2'-O)-methyltransferase RlmB [Clostridia bacterium]|nr:23S rRNA (guanosine(2251)-2'-O)-methyltransferase RlmB [Clostridia bacterium]
MDQKKKRPDRADRPSGEIVAGRNAVRELLLTGRSVDRVFVAKGDGRLGELVALAKEAGVPVVDAERPKLDAMCGGIAHQGVAAVTAAHEFASLDDVFRLAEVRGERPLVVVCDGIEDPHNLGAIIRSAECAGAHGVVIPKRRSVGLNATVAKASAGAVEYVPVVRVSNIPELIEKLKSSGLWVYAADMGGSPYREADFDRGVAIVLGSEGGGISPLAKKRCDAVVSIPMYGRINSLNVSAAAAILLNHAAISQREGGVSHVKEK